MKARTRIIADGVTLDTFGDESIQITRREKDVRDIDKLFADYTTSFSLPASRTNNKLFKHYYNFNVIGAFDARIKIPARIDINENTFKRGLLKLDRCSLKNDRIDVYHVTFFGEAVNLSDTFGETELSDLNWDEYNHVKDITNVTAGLSASGSLFSDDIIYPLISKDKKWTHTTGTDALNPSGSATISPSEFCPAIRVAKVIDKIEETFGLTLASDLFAETHFQNLYLWCPREISSGEAAVIDRFGNPLPFDLNPTGTFVTDVLSYEDGIFNLRGLYSSGYTTARSIVDIVPSDGSSYTFKIVAEENGVWKEIYSTSTSGTQLFSFAVSDTDNYDKLRYYIESTSSFTVSFDLLIQYERTGSPNITAIDFGAPRTGIQIDNYGEQLRFNIPTLRVSEFFGGIVRMFNLMIKSTSPTEFTLEPYDDWKANGVTVDLTDRVDIKKSEVVTPKLPSRINFNYQEPKSISAARWHELFNKSYGDLESRTEGTDSARSIELPFENMMWDKLTDSPSSLHCGFSFDEPNSPIENKAYLMYWGDDITQTIKLIGGTLANYKACGSYYPLTTPTHSLNFGAEINTYDYTPETISLFNSYHENFITTIFHEALRLHKFDMVIPPHVVTESDSSGKLKLDLDATVKIKDRYYNINSMQVDLLTGEASLELINYVRGMSVITPPVDTSPPTAPILAVVPNPDTTAPTIGTLSYSNVTGDSVVLSWTAASDDVGVDVYDIYQDTVKVKTVLGNYTSTLITGLSNNTEYDFYIKAKDAAENESTASNTVTFTTLDVNAPVITSPVTNWYYVPSGGAPVSYQITATNSPNLYGALNVPSFMSINTSSGLVSGTANPSDAGSYTMQVRASNNSGTSWGQYQDVVIVIIPT